MAFVHFKGLSYLVAEFIRPPKLYTFSFIVDNIIPKSVKCIHSTTKVIGVPLKGSIGVPFKGSSRVSSPKEGYIG